MIAQRRIGSTGLSVSTLGFGGAPLGGLYTPTSDAVAAETIAAAYAGGIRYFDTAPFYGHGLSERRIGDGLRRYPRGEIILSSKVGRLLRRDMQAPSPGDRLPFLIEYDYGYDGVMRSLEDSYQRLGLNRIDIALLHDVNRRWHGDDVDRRFEEAMSGGYRALDELRRAGVLQAIGVGVNDPSILCRFADAGQFDCFMLAGRYTLLEQHPLDDLLPLCERRGISILIAAPFASGILATGAVPGATYFYTEAPPDIVERTRRIEEVCRRHDVPLPAAALQFPPGHPAVASVVAGFRSPEEVRVNLRFFNQSIPAALWQELKQEKLLRSDAPVPEEHA